jgi:alpha,alpha-trehalase
MTDSAAATGQIWSEEPPARAPATYRPIRDYALVGDCHGSALVARDGGVDWCCLGRFDAEAVFCRVLDADRGGFLDVRPEQPFRTTREYLPDTNILRTTFATAEGRVALTDFMPVDRRAGAAEDDFTSLEAPCWFVRVVEGIEGRVRLRVRFRPSGPDCERHSPAAPA